MKEAHSFEWAFLVPGSAGLLERCTEFFCWSPSMNQRVYSYLVRPVQERAPISIGITGLAYQCLPQWMMAGYEVVVPCVQPGQVFRLGRSGQLTSIAGLAGQHQVPHTV